MVFLGREISEQRDYSEKVAEEIDEEVRRLIDQAYQTAKRLLTEYRAKLDEIVDHILIEETLDGDKLTKLLASPVGELPLPTTESKPEPKKEEPPADEPEKQDEPKTPPVKGEPGLAYGSQSNIQTESDS
jgi:cell division protease FtsH